MVAFELCTDNKQDAPFALLPTGHIIHGFQKNFYILNGQTKRLQEVCLAFVDATKNCVY